MVRRLSEVETMERIAVLRRVGLRLAVLSVAAVSASCDQSYLDGRRNDTIFELRRIERVALRLTPSDVARLSRYEDFVEIAKKLVPEIRTSESAIRTDGWGNPFVFERVDRDGVTEIVIRSASYEPGRRKDVLGKIVADGGGAVSVFRLWRED